MFSFFTHSTIWRAHTHFAHQQAAIVQDRRASRGASDVDALACATSHGDRRARLASCTLRNITRRRHACRHSSAIRAITRDTLVERADDRCRSSIAAIIGRPVCSDVRSRSLAFCIGRRAIYANMCTNRLYVSS